MKYFSDIKIRRPVVTPTAEECVAKTLGYINELYNKIDYLERQLEPYKQGTKDNETIQRLEAEVAKLRAKDYFCSSFNFTEEEYHEGNEWIAAHLKEAHDGYKIGGVSGGSFTWYIIPTGLGNIRGIECSCGAHCDLTKDFG